MRVFSPNIPKDKFILLYNHVMTAQKKSIRNNIQILKNLRESKRGRIPNALLGKVNNIVELYEERKIVQLATAENLINSSATNDTKKREKALKKYEAAVENMKILHQPVSAWQKEHKKQERVKQ